MTTHLLLAPAASGKTHACLEQVRAVLQATPLSTVWVLLPDRNQAIAFRRRLADIGGALGARVGTFGDLYAELLALADASIPVAPEPVLHRLVQAAVDTLAERDQLQHYRPIQRRPGLVLALSDLIAELKRSRIISEQFKEAVVGSGRRLEELAAVYQHYQSLLIRFGWADPEGLGWLAILELQTHGELASGWHFFVDGFDSFVHTQLETLELIGARAGSLMLTLTGEPEMNRLAHRRFKRTLEALQSRLTFAIETAPAQVVRPGSLAHLESALLVTQSAKLPADQHIHFIEAQTQALEAREALRWLKARIVRDSVPINSCAVIARDLAPYEPFLREVGREFGMPIHFAGGEPLVRNPAVAAILSLLELRLNNWARRPVLDVLRTPYFDLSIFGFIPGDAARLDDVARWGQVMKGLDQWREALDRLVSQPEPVIKIEDDESHLPMLPRGAVAARLQEALDQFVQHFTPPEAATPKTFVAWLEELQANIGLEGRVNSQPDTAARDGAAMEAFRETLRALVLTDNIFGLARTITFDEFYTQLRGAISAAIYMPEALDRRKAIYAANLTAARGVPYTAVVVLGLSEGLFPSPIAEDPFLSDDERRSLNAQGLPLELRLRSDQQSLFYEAVTRAERYLLLTRPYLAEDGETWEPSPYWNSALALFAVTPERVRREQSRRLADAASEHEALEEAIRRRTLPEPFTNLATQWTTLQHASHVLAARLASEPAGSYEGEVTELADILSQRYDRDYVWSTSRLELYGTCRFQFYTSAALELEPREPPQPSFNVMQLGSILHKILESVYQTTDSTDPNALIDALPTIAQPILDSAPRDLGFRPTPLWKTQQVELLATLAKTIRNLAAESDGWMPIKFELRFDALALQTPNTLVRLHGVIDRVDRNRNGELRVIDYKTGAGHLDSKALIKGRRLQLPLYAAAVEQALKLGSVVDGFYWAARKGEAGQLSLAKFEHKADGGHTFKGVDGAIQLVAEHIDVSVRGILAGEFAPDPPDGGCPDYCPAKSFCWRYTPGW